MFEGRASLKALDKVRRLVLNRVRPTVYLVVSIRGACGLLFDISFRGTGNNRSTAKAHVCRVSGFVAKTEGVRLPAVPLTC